jgi:hemerythrin-like domain-containing protein
MTITEALVAEHGVFCRLFDQVERDLPGIQSLDELRRLAGMIEAVLLSHAEAEEQLVLVALNHLLEHRGRPDHLKQEHHELDECLRRVQAAEDSSEARHLLRLALQASRSHFHYEERAVFPLVDQELGPATLAGLGESWAEQQRARVQ